MSQTNDFPSNAKILGFPTQTLSKRQKVRQKLDRLLCELQTYYGDSVTGFIDDVTRAADGKTGLRGALLQIEWIEGELEAFQQIDAGD
jgi:hypothetical protein